MNPHSTTTPKRFFTKPSITRKWKVDGNMENWHQFLQVGLEPLQLLFEEAFFLANKKMLTVLDNSGSAMSVSELWTALCEINPNISISFFVYNHYRNLGWIPKSGLKFGGDFILYDAGPDECHSKYGI
eukprot:TRINITY_DN2153_c0_g2_i9.p1 TRINITY_DN2153_c0_g2~~TRINITY_DN2153_c0_g2_i9.p1  ORF type:complete len:128 (+),score=18.44 TRINITY_DN2153_c0_g2_i9:146-529(+)